MDGALLTYEHLLYALQRGFFLRLFGVFLFLK